MRQAKTVSVKPRGRIQRVQSWIWDRPIVLTVVFAAVFIAYETIYAMKFHWLHVMIGVIGAPIMVFIVLKRRL